MVNLGDDAKDGQIGLRRGFVQPVLAVRPRAVMQHIRQMSMQDQYEITKLVRHADDSK